VGSATYQQYRVAKGSAASDCLDMSAFLTPSARFYPGVTVSYSPGATSWTVQQYPDCSGYSSNNFLTRSYSLDSSCYNFKDGSFSVYVPGQSGMPAANSLVQDVSLHTPQYPTPPVTTTVSQVGLALWFYDTRCLSGSAFTTTVTNGGCQNTKLSPSGTNQYSYKLSCSSKSTTSTWTLYTYSATGCLDNNAHPVIRGTGAQCVAINHWDSSAFIDCATQASGRYFNYLPADPPVIDGVWGVWSECSATVCGQSGVQTRACNSPPPANGGAPCVGESQRVCSQPQCPPCPSDQTCQDQVCWTSGGYVPIYSCSCLNCAGRTPVINDATSSGDCSSKCLAADCTLVVSSNTGSTRYVGPTATSTACSSPTFDSSSGGSSTWSSSGSDVPDASTASTTTSNGGPSDEGVNSAASRMSFKLFSVMINMMLVAVGTIIYL